MLVAAVVQVMVLHLLAVMAVVVLAAEEVLATQQA
jgi:hypothetical protein